MRLQLLRYCTLYYLCTVLCNLFSYVFCFRQKEKLLNEAPDKNTSENDCDQKIRSLEMNQVSRMLSYGVP